MREPSYRKTSVPASRLGKVYDWSSCRSPSNTSRLVFKAFKDGMMIEQPAADRWGVCMLVNGEHRHRHERVVVFPDFPVARRTPNREERA